MSNIEKQMWLSIQPFGKTRFVLWIIPVIGLPLFFANLVMVEKITVGVLLFLSSVCLLGGLIVGLSTWYVFKKKFGDPPRQ